MDYNGKKILVCGIARSGVASALLLKRLGAEVTAQDLKTREKLEPFASQLEENGVALYIGKNPDDILAGFDLMIVSPGIPCDLPFFDKAFALALPVWGEIELAYSVCNAPVIAITGTNGKTTTTSLTGEIMAAHRTGSVTVGNIGTPFTEKAADVPDNAYVVAEISSFQMETAYTFHPHIAAVLNITPDHLNRHKTLECYIEMKERVFRHQTEEDFLILNDDDEACRDMAARAKSKPIFFSYTHELAEGVFLKDGCIWAKLLRYDESILPISELRTPFSHIIEDMMAAAAMAICAGADLDVIRKVLRAFKGVEHRVEHVASINGVDYYNDSKATNIDAAVKALEAIDRPVVLIGGGLDKDCPFGDWVKLFPGKVKFIAVLGETADQIIDTCNAHGFADYDKVNSLKDAVALCHAKAVAGDCVLLSPACASWDMFDSYEQRGALFKQFVNDLA